MPSEEPYFDVDLEEVRRSFDRAAPGYDDCAVLQAAVREELLGRLDYVTLKPGVVLDVGCGTGHAAEALGRRYPDAAVVALDLSEGMLRQAGRRQAAAAPLARVCGDAMRLPFGDASADLVFSSLMLPWCSRLDVALAEFRRVLRPGGLLNFSTVGPGTLVELRSAWAAADNCRHVGEFVDMHDIGDGLLLAGLAEPVLDTECYTLTYVDIRALMRDLKAMGAHNAAVDRPRGMTGRQRLLAVEAAYEQYRREGRLPATCEIIFGQAWGPAGEAWRGRRRGEFVVEPQAIGRRAVTA